MGLLDGRVGIVTGAASGIGAATVQLAAREGARVVAHVNPKDQRLIASGEVRDLTPVRDDAGRIVALPQLERVLLDALEGMPRVLDVAAQVPHCALRAYVLGERAHDTELTADEIDALARLTLDGLRAGAVGFSTSRTILHRSVHGLVPGTRSHPEELLVIGRAMGAAGHARPRCRRRECGRARSPRRP